MRILRIKAVVFDFDGTLVPFKMDYTALRQGIIRKIAERGIQTEDFKVSDPIRVTLKKTREILNDKDMEILEREAEEIITFYELEGTKNNCSNHRCSRGSQNVKRGDESKASYFYTQSVANS